MVVVDVVVVVVEDVVVVVDDVVVVGGSVVVVVVVVVVVGGSVVEVVVEGRLVGPKLASDSGPAFLTATVDGSDNTTVSASFVTKRPCVGTNAASALY